MRLRDMMDNAPGPGDEDPKKKRRASPRPPGDPSKGEESFRLSRLADFGALKGDSPRPPQTPGTEKPEEEKPIELPPDIFGPSPQAAPRAPSETPAAAERPAPAPPAQRRPTPPAAPPSAGSARRRASVLLGSDVERGASGESLGGRKQTPEARENPFRKFRQRGIEYITRVLQAAAKNGRFTLDEAEDLLFDWIETPDALEQLYALAVSTKDTSNSLATHLVNHACYALKLGVALKWSTERLVRLGVASLIHDIGMCRVPRQIRHKEGKLTPEEMSELKRHPEYGMQIIMQNFGKPFRWLAEAVYHEHEREDGRGYPQGLLGNEISEYAKVIGLADVYEALTHNRPHRKRLLPHKAVQEIIQTQKTSFHQRLLKIMLEELSVFSLDSLVRLNSNAIGRVVQTVPGQPLRPVIQLLFDADGHEVLEEKQIALRDFPLLYIVDSVDESEIAG